MIDRFDRAIRTMFLRRKLRAIEARRIKYPQTYEGRKRYIQDSLNEKKPKVKFCYYFFVIIGIAGMILSLTWCIKGIDYKGAWLCAILSMVFIALGIKGLEGRPE